VDVADVSALMTALSDLPTYQGNLTGIQLAEIADLTSDNLVNNKDVQSLIIALANGGSSSLTAVPEPDSLVQGAIAALALSRFVRRRRT
jgi:hypothetical protein